MGPDPMMMGPMMGPDPMMMGMDPMMGWVWVLMMGPDPMMMGMGWGPDPMMGDQIQ